MHTTLKQVLTRSGLFLLLCVPFEMAFATVVASSTITVSNLRIAPATGTVAFSGPPDVSAFANAFNSLGESDSHGASGTGIDVQADAAVAFATGHAEASAAAGLASATSTLNLGGQGNEAGVSFPGSIASLSGLFDLTGVSGMVDVSFSMDLSALLHGFTDALGSFDADADASLEIDGMPVLFDFFSLSGGPNFPDTTQPFSETLSATLSLDSALSHFFILTAHDDVEGMNSVPEPSTIALLLLGLGLLHGWSQIGSRLRKRHQLSQPSQPRHSV